MARQWELFLEPYREPRWGWTRRFLQTLGLCAAALGFLGGVPRAAASEVTLGWDSHPETAVYGFRIHYGFQSGVYSFTTNVGFRTSARISVPFGGVRYYFAASALSTNGLESAFSAEVSHIPTPAGAVTLAEKILRLPEDGDVLLAPDAGAIPVAGWIVVLPPRQGQIFLETGGYRYVPGPDYHGEDSVRFALVNANLTTTVLTFRCVVEPVNDRPVAEPGEVVVPFGQPTAVRLVASDVDGTVPGFEVRVPPKHGTLSGTAPNLVYAAEAGYVGADSFTYVATDGGLESAPAVMTLDVRPPNQPPVVSGLILDLQEDGFVDIDVTATDPEGDELVYELISGPTNGFLDGDLPVVMYLPSDGFSGRDRFEFAVRDPYGGTAVAGVTLNIAPVNDAPDVFSGFAQVISGVRTRLPLIGGDPDGDALTFRVEGPEHGEVSEEDGQWYYRSENGYVGFDTLQVVASDGLLESESVLMEVEVFEQVRVTVVPRRRDDGGWEVELTWATREGSRYQLVSRELGDAEGWVPVGEVVTALGNGSQTQVVGLEPGKSSVLFAVEILEAL